MTQKKSCYDVKISTAVTLCVSKNSANFFPNRTSPSTNSGQRWKLRVGSGQSAVGKLANFCKLHPPKADRPLAETVNCQLSISSSGRKFWSLLGLHSCRFHFSIC